MKVKFVPVDVRMYGKGGCGLDWKKGEKKKFIKIDLHSAVPTKQSSFPPPPFHFPLCGGRKEREGGGGGGIRLEKVKEDIPLLVCHTPLFAVGERGRISKKETNLTPFNPLFLLSLKSPSIFYVTSM